MALTDLGLSEATGCQLFVKASKARSYLLTQTETEELTGEYQLIGKKPFQFRAARSKRQSAVLEQILASGSIGS